MGLSIPKPNGTPPTRILSRSPWIQRVTCAGCAAGMSEMSRMRVGSWHRSSHTSERFEIGARCRSRPDDAQARFPGDSVDPAEAPSIILGAGPSPLGPRASERASRKHHSLAVTRVRHSPIDSLRSPLLWWAFSSPSKRLSRSDPREPLGLSYFRDASLTTLDGEQYGLSCPKAAQAARFAQLGRVPTGE